MIDDELKHRVVMIETQAAALAAVVACLVEDQSPESRARVLQKVDDAFERLHVFLLAGEGLRFRERSSRDREPANHHVWRSSMKLSRSQPSSR